MCCWQTIILGHLLEEYVSNFETEKWKIRKRERYRLRQHTDLYLECIIIGDRAKRYKDRHGELGYLLICDIDVNVSCSSSSSQWNAVWVMSWFTVHHCMHPARGSTWRCIYIGFSTTRQHHEPSVCSCAIAPRDDRELAGRRRIDFSTSGLSISASDVVAGPQINVRERCL